MFLYFLFYFLMVWLAFLPSIIWLRFFLRFDKHPEPQNSILRTFLWGMLAAPIAMAIEPFLEYIFRYFAFSAGFVLNWSLFGFILIAPIVEEILKYGTAKIGYWEFPAEFDEPVDFMVYLITVALGFAAIENVVYFLGTSDKIVGIASGIIWGSILLFGRFLTANLLHALTAAIIGFFIALSWRYQSRHYILLVFGLIVAIIVHSSYNYCVFNLNRINGVTNLVFLVKIGILIGFLGGLLLLIIYLLKSLSNVSSICKIKSKKSKLKVRKIYG